MMKRVKHGEGREETRVLLSRQGNQLEGSDKKKENKTN